RWERLQEQWDAQADPNSWDNQVGAHYQHLSANDAVRMWEAGTNEKSNPLTRFELAALIERWCELFGCLPPSDPGGQGTPPATRPPAPGATLDDLNPMPRADVARRLRASISTIHHTERDGRLPKPLRTGPRARRHLVRDVNALIERLEHERDMVKHRG